jgi:hypothetical protein
VKAQVELSVWIPVDQLIGCPYGERGLADTAHSLDDLDQDGVVSLAPGCKHPHLVDATHEVINAGREGIRLTGMWHPPVGRRDRELPVMSQDELVKLGQLGARLYALIN